MIKPKPNQCGDCNEYSIPGVMSEGWCNLFERDVEPEDEGCGHWDDGE